MSVCEVGRWRYAYLLQEMAETQDLRARVLRAQGDACAGAQHTQKSKVRRTTPYLTPTFTTPISITIHLIL